jgi:hypothetical protein
MASDAFNRFEVLLGSLARFLFIVALHLHGHVSSCQ